MKKKKKITSLKHNLSTFSDISLKTLIDKSSSPAIVEAAKKVLSSRNVPYPHNPA